MFVQRKQGSLLSVYVDGINMAGEKWNIALMLKKLMNNVDLDEPTSFLFHENLGCTQRECKPNEKIIGQYNKMFESRISAGATENYQDGTNHAQKLQRGPRHGRTCSKMRRTMLRIGKQEDGATAQGFQSLFGRSPIQAGARISWRIVRSLLAHCLEMLVPGTNW